MSIVEIVGCVLVADLLSGLFHWLEDSYGHEDWPITGRHITAPNVLHHHDPGAFTSSTWFESARVSLVLGAGLLFAAWALGALAWQFVLVVVIGVNANEIHKWAHRNPHRNGRIISFLQGIGVLQSARHHARHHRGTKATHYCVVTNYLNPVLERFGLWRLLERGVFLTCGVRPRPDHSVTRDDRPLVRVEGGV